VATYGLGREPQLSAAWVTGTSRRGTREWWSLGDSNP
jgi:hypothetical protein